MPRPPKDPNAEQVDPRTKFKAAADKRVNTAVRAIANVAKLPRTGRKPNDTSVIIAALTRAVDTCSAHLDSGAPSDGFTLPE